MSRLDRIERLFWLVIVLLVGCSYHHDDHFYNQPDRAQSASWRGPVRDAGEPVTPSIGWTYFGASNGVPIWGVATVMGTDAGLLTLERSEDLQSWRAVTNCNWVRPQTVTYESDEPLLDREFWRWRLVSQ